MTALAQVFIYTNQMWGDLGLLSTQGIVLTAATFSTAARVSVLTGAWPGRRQESTARTPNAARMPQPKPG
jgi:hypothetical protein